MRRSRRANLLTLLLAGVWIAPCGWSGEPEGKAGEPVAVIAGESVYEEDLLPRIQSQLRQLRNQEYELKLRALESLINQKLTEREAVKKGITVDQFLEQETDAKIADPTDREIEAFYQTQKERLNRPLAEVRDQIVESLKQAKLQQTRQDFFQKLRASAAVSVFLQPPRMEMAYDPARVRGNPNAPVTIVEFSDFQCPYCQRAYTTIKEVLAKYAGRVKLSYRDFPLRQIHEKAQIAAEASRCAGEQAKFWEYHDLLFDNFGKLDKPYLVDYAAQLGLNAKQFGECLASGKFNSQIEEDLQAGLQGGVGGTPAFFVNGIFLNGAQPVAAFEKIIEAELAAKGALQAAQ